MKILVVEDKPAHADLICRPLSNLAETILVDSVEDAKKVMMQDLQIFCIILDLQIYKHSKVRREVGEYDEIDKVDTEYGIELLKYLTNEIKYPQDQIFVTTSHISQREEVKKYVPPEKIIAKPFSTARLRSRVEKLLHEVRQHYNHKLIST